ncbi:hypothetical protein GCM10009675_40230 [Prauserella alba]|uniref:Uncharacterized protein n=1 Tax=Prauserella alba TaxID=176898 RepID=A0ABN1VJM7_9PSEU
MQLGDEIDAASSHFHHGAGGMTELTGSDLYGRVERGLREVTEARKFVGFVAHVITSIGERRWFVSLWPANIQTSCPNVLR